MIHLWKLQALFGPMRPFLAKNILDRLREQRRVRALRGCFPSTAYSREHLRSAIVPLPDAQWLGHRGQEVVAFANRMVKGDVNAFGVSKWVVGGPDPDGVDVRSVHELSRMHHWCAYALAAHLETDKRDYWCEALAREIRVFMDSSPAETGIHWAFPMGTALRLYSMLVAWDWACRTGWSGEEHAAVVVNAAVDHARSTYARLESRGGLSTSHYAANLLGLAAAGRYLDIGAESEEWLRVARQELRSELTRQILPDGMVQEASTGYHRQVTDIFVQATHLIEFTPDEKQRIASACTNLRELELFGMPLIGDNDDGLAVKLVGLVPDTGYLHAVFPTAHVSDVTIGARHKEAFGLVLLANEHFHVTMRNGPVGQFGKGGHAHNDANSITVSVGGNPVIVDPGTSLYTQDPNVRNQERGVHSHATMWAENSNPRTLLYTSEGLFWLLERGTGSMQFSETSASGEYSSGELTHSRQFRVEPESIICTDELRNQHGAVEGVISFPLAPNIVPKILDNAVLLQGPSLSLELTWSQGEIAIEPLHVAPYFALRQESLCVRLRTSACTWQLRRTPHTT